MMRILAIVIVLLIQGCVSMDKESEGARFEMNEKPSNGQALAYFFQPDMAGVWGCLLVGVDDVHKGCIGYPGFAKVEIEPGSRKISFTPNALIKIANLSYNYDFESNKVYYFEYQHFTSKAESKRAVESHYNMLLDYHLGWVLLEESEAINKLKTLKAWQ
jgi:hypothetical protein